MKVKARKTKTVKAVVLEGALLLTGVLTQANHLHAVAADLAYGQKRDVNPVIQYCSQKYFVVK